MKVFESYSDAILVLLFIIGVYLPSLYALYDLAFVSRRSNKILWALIIITIPLISVAVYNETKKRAR